MVNKIPVHLSINAEGFVLGNVAEYVDPFYHASALLHTTTEMYIGKNSSVGLRFVGEVRNFSKNYGNRVNSVIWAKPFIKGKLVNIPLIDSVTVHAGDLWRVKHGQGLMVDYFESQGLKINAYMRKLSFHAFFAGAGLNSYDDLYSFSLTYNNLFSIRYFLDYFGSSTYYSDMNVISVDALSNINNHITIYSEGAMNVQNYAKAGLAGVSFLYEWKGNFIEADVQYRHYDRLIWSENPPREYKYFFSLTALDKPVNNYYLYLIRDEKTDVAAARIKAMLFLYKKFYLSADLEPSAGDEEYFAYETALGYAAEKNVLFRIGVMNKFFRDADLFYGFDSYIYILLRRSKCSLSVINHGFL